MKIIFTIFLTVITFSATSTWAATEKKKGHAKIAAPQPTPPSKATLNFCEAAKNGNLEMMEVFLEQGADINSTNCDFLNETPLIHSVQPDYYHLDVFDFLLSHDASPNLQTPTGTTALMNLVRITSQDSVLTQIPALFEGGAQVDLEDANGNTALIHAVSTLQPDSVYTDERKIRKSQIIRDLVSVRGADINHQNKIGMTPLMIAAQNCGRNTVQLLLELKADTKISTPTGDTAMTLAAEVASYESHEGACTQSFRMLKAVQN
ncbi:MAG: hypothetical protein HOO97_00135 [Sideroxydans sp.]|nr:hypothetical protein [Sideroxydans sp.]